MVELRCPDCKRVWQYDGNSKFYTHCPQCEKVVWIARPRNYGRNNPKVRKLKRHT
jgi:phage FluMu protein Com